jgi:SAM-dependent methyltransferase
MSGAFTNVVAGMEPGYSIDWRTYEAMYARYMRKPPGVLVDVAGDVSGKTVLDLCGGSGRMSEACLARGAAGVVMVEPSTLMSARARELSRSDGRLRIEHVSVGGFLERMMMTWESGDFSPDVVLCRQAVNYWFDTTSARHLAMIMRSGSVFAFNTFNRKPSEKPSVREYEIGGDGFVEVSCLAGDLVHHVQCREGCLPHLTTFLWISPEEFGEALELHFDA